MTVAATFGPALSTKAAASAVVICSNTILSAGKSRTSGARTRSMNTASRSNTSTSGSVTSPWTQQRHADPLHRARAPDGCCDVGDAVGAVGRGVGRIELGGGEHAGLEAARDLVRVGMVGQVAGHQRREVRGRGTRRGCARDRPRPRRRVVTGGARLGITIARANWRAVWPATALQHRRRRADGRASRRAGGWSGGLRSAHAALPN